MADLAPDPAALAESVRVTVRELAESGDPSSFPALLAISEEVGIALGVAARRMAETGSWSQVAAHAGTSKQAAWSRWRG